MDQVQRAEIYGKFARDARQAADSEIARLQAHERCEMQNQRIDILAKRLAELHFKSAPLVLVQHRQWTERPYGVAIGGTPRESYETFITQFVCHITYPNKLADTSRPHYGTSDRCFGLTDRGKLFIGYTDNRQFPETFDAHKHVGYAELLIEVLEQLLQGMDAEMP